VDPPDVSAVVVCLDGLPYLERCLESVRGCETIVVDHGSTDGSLELVRSRFPEVRVVEQANVGMGGGNNAGMRAASGRYFLLLNSDAWVVGDAVERLVALADSRPDAAVVGPRLRNVDGTLQRSVRGFPTLWRVATEYFFLRKLAPRSRLLNSLYGAGFDHASLREVDWVSGACLFVRREAAEAVGLFDEDFFMFSEETDWCYRFRKAGWTVLFCPDAEVVHVGGASHGGRLYRENLRGHLRFFAKHRGPAEAERARRMLLLALRLRGRLFPGERGRTYREAARWLASAPAAKLLLGEGPPARARAGDGDSGAGR
jgi:GT2 family glycosyltransferase